MSKTSKKPAQGAQSAIGNADQALNAGAQAAGAMAGNDLKREAETRDCLVNELSRKLHEKVVLTPMEREDYSATSLTRVTRKPTALAPVDHGDAQTCTVYLACAEPVSYTHLRAHET